MQNRTTSLQLLVFFILLAFQHGLSAQEGSSKHLASNQEKVSLNEILKELSTRHALSLNYNPETVQKIFLPKHQLPSQQLPAEEYLQVLVKKVDLNCIKLDENHFVIKPSASISQQERIQVSGKVVDEQNQPLPGVNVLEKGSSNGTITDADGQFSLQIAGRNSSLLFSFVGYQSQEIAVGKRREFRVALAMSSKELTEVVVTALGISREQRALGYSVAQLDGDAVSKVKEAHVVNSLAGKVAGVNIRNTSPDAGSSVLITIRGQSSLTGNNQPLFVIDGVPVVTNNANVSSSTDAPIDFGNPAIDINPDDVASISILKGASAAALYGSRAGNGVVLITTKSGKGAKKGLGVSFNSSVTLDQPWLYPEFQNEFGAGDREGTNETLSDASWGPRLDKGTKHLQWDSPLDGEGKPLPTDWVAYPDRHKDFFQTGQTFNNNIAITGNYNEGDFRFSYSNLYNRGIVPNTNLKKNNFNLNAGYHLAKNLKVRGTVSYIQSESDNRPASYKSSENIIETLYRTTPNINVVKLSDYWMENRKDLEQKSHLPGEADNPYFVVHENTNSFLRNRVIGNVKLDYEIVPGLSVMLRSGVDFYNEERENKRAFSTLKYPKGAYMMQKLYYQEINHDFLLTYNKSIHDHQWYFSFSLGGNRMDRKIRDSAHKAERLNLAKVYNVSNAAAGTLIGTQNNSWKRVNSIYGMAQFAYQNMIFLDVTARNDWSSTLPLENNAYFYPSVSFSTVFTDLFKIDSRFFSYGKIRANFAQVGNDTGPYQLYNTYDFENDWGDVKRASISTLLKNSRLKPEISTTYEGGVDLQFFNGRIGLDLTYYKTSSRNQIIRIPTSITSGASEKLVNAGEIQNSGWEIALKATPVKVKNLQWNTTVNFTRNENKVIKLVEGVERFRLGEATGIYEDVYEGGSLGDLYDKRTWLTIKEGELKGEYVVNEEGYPVRDNTWTKVGNYNPDFMLGWHNTLSWKKLQLDFLIDWRKGGEFYAYTAKNLLSDGRTTVTVHGRDEQSGGLPWVDGNGVARNDGMIIPGYIDNGDGTYRANENIVNPEDYYGSIYWDFEEFSTFSAAYVKLREVSLTYHLDKLANWPISGLYISLTGRNLYAWFAYKKDNKKGDFIYTDYDKGYDPETQVIPSGSGFKQGVAAWSLPATRSFGMKLGFDF
ncbi:SusC/RagA family TonB-linked outer membrane protein [Rapidithrix thailandica]|uniref:SusC/RagA family TonB-linked outer membrane protein n=1 Tax=Rapidithrix thailandica TaxID=413964 RepID=A0AAW9S2G1_9BACT